MAANRPLTVLYYPTGAVHLRNLDVLRRLPGCRFRVIVEPWLAAQPAALACVPDGERVAAADGGLSADAWAGVHLLFFCMAAPNRFRFTLLREARSRSIPAVAVEEVNQLALNDGRINHYVLPLTGLGAASEEERTRFLPLGWAPPAVSVTGWPFGAEPAAVPAPRNGGGAARTCLLVLGSLKERDIVSLETRAVRRRILETLAGLPDPWQLEIKPHPIETSASLAEIRLLAPRARLIEPQAAIEPLLDGADLVANRGNSQAVLQAMRRSKPLAVIPAGLPTIFHGHLDEVLAESPRELAAIAARAAAGAAPDYQPLLTRHWPLGQAESLRRVEALFDSALRPPAGEDTRAAGLLLALIAAHIGLEREAAALLADPANDAAAGRLASLLDGSFEPASWDALTARLPGAMPRWHLQAQLVRLALRRPPRGAALAGLVDRLDGFCGEMNAHYFIDELVGRAELEFRLGRRAAAEDLLARLEPEYGVFPFRRQAFGMLRFAYRHGRDSAGLRRGAWLLGHPHAAWTRRVIGRRWRKR